MSMLPSTAAKQEVYNVHFHEQALTHNHVRNPDTGIISVQCSDASCLTSYLALGQSIFYNLNLSLMSTYYEQQSTAGSFNYGTMLTRMKTRRMNGGTEQEKDPSRSRGCGKGS